MRTGSRRPLYAFLGCIVFVVVIPACFFVWLLISPPRCIVEGTWVDTPSGRRRIEEIRVGDDVRTRAPDGSYRTGRVLRSIPTSTLQHLQINLSDGRELRVTGSHPIGTPGGWVPAEKLEAGMTVDGPEGPKAILSVDLHRSWARVYDLEIAPDPNFIASGVLVHNKSTNERNALTSLKTIVSAQSDFKNNDRDDNGIRDYWVGDVSSLYTLPRKDGWTIKLIETSVALADIAPLGDLSGVGERGPKAAYNYAVIPLKEDGTPYDDGSHHNRFEYAICAFPISRQAGRDTFIVNESGVVYRKESPKPVRITRWPSALEADGWIRMD